MFIEVNNYSNLHMNQFSPFHCCSSCRDFHNFRHAFHVVNSFLEHVPHGKIWGDPYTTKAD
jgi:hypothetical protein